MSEINTPTRGRRWRAKLTAVQVSEIKQLRSTGTGQCALANQFGVSQATICDLLRGNSYSGSGRTIDEPQSYAAEEWRPLPRSTQYVINNRGHVRHIRLNRPVRWLTEGKTFLVRLYMPLLGTTKLRSVVALLAETWNIERSADELRLDMPAWQKTN